MRARSAVYFALTVLTWFAAMITLNGWVVAGATVVTIFLLIVLAVESRDLDE